MCTAPGCVRISGHAGVHTSKPGRYTLAFDLTREANLSLELLDLMTPWDYEGR